MNIEIIKQDKDELELKIGNLTIAEILRVYLYKTGVEFAAWKREHPSKPLIFKVKSPNAKKSINEAIEAIQEDCEKIKVAIKK